MYRERDVCVLAFGIHKRNQSENLETNEERRRATTKQNGILHVIVETDAGNIISGILFIYIYILDIHESEHEESE